MRHGGFGLLQVAGGQGGCVECIWILSRFVSFLRVEGVEAGGPDAGGLERGQEKGAELEVFAAGIADDADDFDGVAAVRVAGVEFVFPLANALGNPLEGVFKAVADLFFEEVPLEAAQALNLFDGFMMPAAEGGSGDVEPGGNGVEGKALGAEFDELVFGFVIVHRSGRLEVENSQGRDERHEFHEFHEWTRIRATGLAELAPPEVRRLEACDTAD
jgi:hypothetical protein